MDYSTADRLILYWDVEFHRRIFVVIKLYLHFVSVKNEATFQSGALLFSEGDHDLPCTSIPRPTFSHFIRQSNIFLRCFPLLCFPSIIPVVLAFTYYILYKLTSDFVSASRITQLSLISFQSMRLVALSIRTTFLLHPVSFGDVLRLSRPCIYTSEWVQYSTPGSSCVDE